MEIEGNLGCRDVLFILKVLKAGVLRDSFPREGAMSFKLRNSPVQASPKSSPKERTLSALMHWNPLLWRGQGEAYASC
jgi:hypothetical protein